MAAPKSWEQYKEECQPIAESKQIQILGWTGEWKGVNTKLDLLCHCGYKWDTTSINSFKRGSGCPMCAGQIKDLKTYLTECKPIAEAKGITIIGIVEPFKGARTKMMLRCRYGHEWNTCSFDSFKHGSGCLICRYENTRRSQTIPDDQHIADFFSTGKFKEGTIFTNPGERKGCDPVWMVQCPVCSHDEYVKAGLCDGKFYMTRSNLKYGHLPCRCSASYRYTAEQITYKVRKKIEKKGYVWIGWITKPSSIGKFKYVCKSHGEQKGTANNLLNIGQGCPQCANKNQQQAYINYIYDEQDIICALKFGIANNSNRRIKEQNSRNVFTMKQGQVWHFPTVKQCKDAEKRCKRVLHTEAVSKYAMPDGYTETAELSCMASIQNIYKLYGGTLQEETC